MLTSSAVECDALCRLSASQHLLLNCFLNSFRWENVIRPKFDDSILKARSHMAIRAPSLLMESLHTDVYCLCLCQRREKDEYDIKERTANKRKTDQQTGLNVTYYESMVETIKIKK